MKADPAVPLGRKAQIAYVLEKLGSLGGPNTFAIDQNVAFFKAARSFFTYLPWLLHSGSIDHTNLLEINELLPEVDRAFHAKMIEIERKPFPGMISGAVEFLLRQSTAEKKRVRIGSLGSGALEAERQFAEKYLSKHDAPPITIVGFDIADGAHDMAEENIVELQHAGISIIRVGELTMDRLLLEEERAKTRMLVILATNDIFTLPKTFPKHTFDALITVLFLHHLPLAHGRALVAQMREQSEHVAVYDGYRTGPHRLIQSIVGWSHPIFMNAAVFSNLRFLPRADVRKEHTSADITFYSHGHYRAAYDA